MLDDELPRVLFVSVNPFSATSNNGKTFASFFEGYPSERLAQLYFHRELPTSTAAGRYFRLTDEHVLAALPRPWHATGEPLTPAAAEDRKISQRTHTALKSSRTARLARQILWSSVRLDNPRLRAWLDEFSPEVVFFCGGDAISLYPKVQRIIDRHGAASVLYITDDYVLSVKDANLAHQVSRLWLRRSFLRFARRANLVLTIGQQMSDVYHREFALSSRPIMNMVDVPRTQPSARTSASAPLRLLYAGSLHSNRWKTLGALVDSIERLRGQGVEACLRIVGPPPTPEQLSRVARAPFSAHDGLLDPEELRDAIADSDCLVHVEASDPRSMAVTTLSVSTKIPEYVSSGRPILAVGPRGLASLAYLREADVAVTATEDASQLDDAVASLAADPGLRRDLAARGFALARKNHDGAKVRHDLWAELRRLRK